MHLVSRLKVVAATSALVGLLAALAAGGPTSASPGAHASACTQSNDVEAILEEGEVGLPDLVDLHRGGA